eukprot:356668-Chlamydomonas_euryale.AAC.1
MRQWGADQVACCTSTISAPLASTSLPDAMHHRSAARTCTHAATHAPGSGVRVASVTRTCATLAIACMQHACSTHAWSTLQQRSTHIHHAVCMPPGDAGHVPSQSQSQEQTQLFRV